jgi:alpha-1,6-mannosyltransferase
MTPGAAPRPVTLAPVWRYGLPGAVASAMLLIGAFGVGWLPLRTGVISIPIVETLRTTAMGLLLSHILVFVGIALLLQTWLILGRFLADHRPTARDASSPGSAARPLTPWDLGGILALWSAPLLIAPPMFSRDVYSYYAQGRLLLEGYDPYVTGVSVLPGWFQDGVDPMWAETPAPYGPLFLLLSRGVSDFSVEQPALAALVFRLIAVAGVVLIAVYLPRLAFAHGIDPTRALWLGVANPLIVLHFVAGAHNDALMVGLIVMGLTWAVERRPLAGAAAIALAASVKPIALLALPFIGLIWAGRRAGWWQRIRAWAASGAVALATFTATGVVAGVGLGWIAALTTPGEVRTWASPPTAIGMLTGGIAQAIGLAETNDVAVGIARAIGALIAIGIVAWLILGPWQRSPVRGAAWAFLAVVALGPVVQPWYLLWFLPLFAATGVSIIGMRFLVVGTAGFCVHAMAESLATSDSIFEAIDGLGIVLAIIIVAAVLLTSRRERSLILGDPGAIDLMPDDAPARARARRWTPDPPWQDSSP